MLSLLSHVQCTMKLEDFLGGSPGQKVLKDNFFNFLIIAVIVSRPGFLDKGGDEIPKLPVDFEPFKQFALRLGLHTKTDTFSHITVIV